MFSVGSEIGGELIRQWRGKVRRRDFRLAEFVTLGLSCGFSCRGRGGSAHTACSLVVSLLADEVGDQGGEPLLGDRVFVVVLVTVEVGAGGRGRRIRDFNGDWGLVESSRRTVHAEHVE